MAFAAQCLSLPSFVYFHSVSFAREFVGHAVITTAESTVTLRQLLRTVTYRMTCCEVTTHTMFCLETEGTTPLGRTRRRWED